MSVSPALPPNVVQAAITANGQSVIAGSTNASSVGVQVANQVVGQPAAPTLTAGTGDSTLAGGTYQAEITYVNQFGESQVSSASSITITAGQTIVVTAPVLNGNATGWNIYMTQVGAGTFTLQNASPIPLSVGNVQGPSTYTFTSPPISTGANPPSAPAFVGTISFRVSEDGINWVNLTTTSPFGLMPWGGTTPVASATAAGLWTMTFSGLVFFQAVATAWTSGMAIVTISLSEQF